MSTANSKEIKAELFEDDQSHGGGEEDLDDFEDLEVLEDYLKLTNESVSDILTNEDDEAPSQIDDIISKSRNKKWSKYRAV